MIFSCPVCASRVRLDPSRHAGKRIKLRCSKCAEVFQVEVPAALVTMSGPGLPSSLPAITGLGESPVAETGMLKVLVAHGDHALCRTISDVLSRHADIALTLCHSGHDALSVMEQTIPAVAVVDVALPGLFAFELVDKVRRRAGLEQVKLILLSSVYNKMAYKRTPSSLYGADDYIEKHHIAFDLVEKIRRLAQFPAAPPPTTFAAPQAPVEIELAGKSPSEVEELTRIKDVNARIQSDEQTEVAATGSDEALEKALRLARIIVSDIALYNQDRVEEGVRNGTFFVLLEAEINEGRRLFFGRVAADVPHREQMLDHAFNNFIERRRRELKL